MTCFQRVVQRLQSENARLSASSVTIMILELVIPYTHEKRTYFALPYMLLQDKDLEDICLEDICLHMQVGSEPVHSPLSWQVLVMSPDTVKPGLHSYEAVSPGNLPPTETCPLIGSISRGHSRTAGEEERRKDESQFRYGHQKKSLRGEHVGSVPLQTPSFRQVLVRSPAVTSKPKLHAYVAMDPGLFPVTDT